VAFDAVIFDFDGLVIESEAPLFDIWCGIYRDHGGVLTMEQWRHALGTHNGFDPYQELERQCGVRLPRDTWAAYVRDEHVRRCGDEPLRPGVAERLEEASLLGLPVAIASSSSSEWVRPWLERHRLMPYFGSVSTRERVVRVKPAPDLLLLAARELGVAASHCVVFDDTPNGIRAAHAAGMWAVAVPSPVTAGLDFPAPHLTLSSLADRTLAQVRIDLTAANLTNPTDQSEPDPPDRS
jgi:HAD superfamily hydrolase (TIGR01509 family)